MAAGLLLLACAGDGEPEARVCADGERLFGVPGENTGLDDGRCAPVCADCGGEPWSPPTYTAEDLAGWRAWTLTSPFEPLAEDPYGLVQPAEPGPDAVCAASFEAGGRSRGPGGGGSYRLVDHPSTAAALAAGDQVTHFGSCGACSPLADLAVYAEQPDLTEPVRACGLAHLTGTVEELAGCLAELGFTEACANIWAWNSLHTRDACFEVCIAALDEPYHQADGALNACLQCDEDESGAVFQAVAGRTRRNTGLPSSMCRPCSEVRPLVHRYGAPPR